MALELGPCPPRLVELKKQIAGAYPDFEARTTKAWGEILVELEKTTKEIAASGSQVSGIVACAAKSLTGYFG